MPTRSAKFEKISPHVSLISLIWLYSAVCAWADAALLPGANKEIVEETCTACHSAAIIRQNHMDRKKWDETITWMQEKQGLMKLEPEVRKRILDYLADVQGASSKKKKTKQKMYEYEYPANPL